MRFTGHVLDTHDSRDLPYVGANDREPVIGSTDDLDLTAYLPPIRDQIANDCVGHAAATAAFATASADGTPIAVPSPVFPWANARMLGAPVGAPLQNVGCSPRELFKALSGQTVIDSRGLTSGLGLVSEGKWPEIPENLLVVPPDDCYRDGENATIKRYSRVPDGLPAIDGLINALRRRRFPTVCFVVDEAFENVGGTVYMAPSGVVIGSHCMLVVGYSATAQAFRIRNSWGEGFGDYGYCWVGQGFIANHSFDKWVIEVAPERLAA